MTPLAFVDGQPVNVATQDDAIRHCMRHLSEGKGFTLFTLNLDHLVQLRESRAFQAAYANATFVTADGAPVARLARRFDESIIRTTGADLVDPLCAVAAWTQTPIYLFGADEQTLTRVAERLSRDHPSLVIAGMEAPPRGFDPFGPEADAAAERIARSGAKLCFVALGAPKQELFADRMFRRYPTVGWLGVGAALDFMAGGRMRAPRLFRDIGLEWCWRLAQEPRRLGARYARCAALLARLSFGPPSRMRHVELSQ
ncbi:MAG: hypothetical protein BGP06_17845 [Rhizobiales bacterium 65-9]|nr:MAG: hypothetical protein BGP06_17845 [Rhizobiales bacterium 65-9]